jgi:hypothetical protein
VTLGAVGDVIYRIVDRLVVGIGIYAEHREIAGMAWPYPIVGVAAELAY